MLNLLKPSIPLFLLASLLTLGSCSTYGVVPTSMPSYDGQSPEAPREGLADLLTGDVVNAQEQQLRDNLQREIVLDFPMRVGVVYYQLDSRLDKVDQASLLDQAREAFAATEVVKETLLIPQSFVGSNQSFEGLRTLGSRFQTDVLLIITGKHNFSPSRQQDQGFFASFSDTVDYESQVSLEAIALDVYTGTLLKPFTASAKGDRIQLNTEATGFQDAAYDYQKSVETLAWQDLQTQVTAGLTQLKADVTERLANS